tara:strand:- start:235 stop:450 length:216 start_codon:yes stop_codon:yes gene_type:complete
MNKYGDVTGLPDHGSPADRGSSDRYYGRVYDPHWWPEGAYTGCRIEKAQMTKDQIKEYSDAYYSETDRKEW